MDTAGAGKRKGNPNSKVKTANPQNNPHLCRSMNPQTCIAICTMTRVRGSEPSSFKKSIINVYCSPVCSRKTPHSLMLHTNIIKQPYGCFLFNKQLRLSHRSHPYSCWWPGNVLHFCIKNYDTAVFSS